MTNDGGPAYPHRSKVAGTARIFQNSRGMSLLDYFAAKAMAAFLSDSETLNATGIAADKEGMTAREMIAAGAYQVAQSMLKERNRLKEQGEAK